MSRITTHILDTSLGKPAKGVRVTLSGNNGGRWSELGAGETNSDGRVSDLLESDSSLPPGEYRLWFDTGSYYKDLGIEAFYPFVEIAFNIEGDGQHYHVPLLLNPFGYSTYRGS